MPGGPVPWGGLPGLVGWWLAGRRPGLEDVSDALQPHRDRAQRDDEEARDTIENRPERELQQARPAACSSRPVPQPDVGTRVGAVLLQQLPAAAQLC